MTGVARAAAPFLLGFDCLEPVSVLVANDFWKDGFRWVARYLNGPSPLTPTERDDLFSIGFGIAPLLVAETSDELTNITGSAYGFKAVRLAMALGIPPSVHITEDYESPAEGSDVLAHERAMTAAIRSGGFDAAAYIGSPLPLNASQVYSMSANRYWRAGGLVPEPACGWAAMQLHPLDQIRFGQRIDVDVTCLDYRGRALTMWWPK